MISAFGIGIATLIRSREKNLIVEYVVFLIMMNTRGEGLSVCNATSYLHIFQQGLVHALQQNKALSWDYECFGCRHLIIFRSLALET